MGAARRSCWAEMYVQGASMRKVKAIEKLCGHEFSASTISPVHKTLDEEMEKFARRKLEEVYPYLILGARYERVREVEDRDQFAQRSTGESPQGSPSRTSGFGFGLHYPGTTIVEHAERRRCRKSVFRLRAQTPHERHVVHHDDPHFFEVFTCRPREEVVIACAEDIGLTDYRRLHHNDVVHVSNRSGDEGVQLHIHRVEPKEGDVAVDKVFGEVINSLQPRIPQDARELMKHLVRNQQRVAAFDDLDQQIARQAMRMLIGADQNRCIKNDLHRCGR